LHLLIKKNYDYVGSGQCVVNDTVWLSLITTVHAYLRPAEYAFKFPYYSFWQFFYYPEYPVDHISSATIEAITDRDTLIVQSV